MAIYMIIYFYCSTNHYLNYFLIRIIVFNNMVIDVGRTVLAID